MLEDSESLLDEATKMLMEIVVLYEKSLDKRIIPNSLRVRIKNYLENIRSALDYPANYIFEFYCAQNFPPDKIERKRKSIYFPIRKTKTLFDTCINDDFKGLTTAKPSIVSVFEKHQSFNSTNWLEILNHLNNSNKHRNLAIQERIIKDRIIKIGGITLTNCSFDNNKGGDIRIGRNIINMDEDNIPKESHPEMKVSVRVDFVFKDLNISVIETLTEILANSKIVIAELKTNI